MQISRALMSVFAAVSILAAPATAQTPPSPERAQLEALHKDLRAVKARLVDAVNKKDSKALIAELSPNVAFTAINNDTVIGVEKVKAYYDKMMSGSASFMNDFSITAEADDVSRLYASDTIAIATGKSDAKLDLRGGSQMKYTVPLRWTATLERTTGQWKLAAIHFSADLSDNPYLSALSTFWKWVAAAIGAIALGIGYVIGWRRRGARV